MNSLAMALSWAAGLANFERNPAEVDRLASELIELSTRHNFAYWLALGAIHRGCTRSASGNAAEGIRLIEQGIRDIRATGTVLALPGYLARKAEALHLLGRSSEALEAINEAGALAWKRRIPYLWSMYVIAFAPDSTASIRSVGAPKLSNRSVTWGFSQISLLRQSSPPLASLRRRHAIFTVCPK